MTYLDNATTSFPKPPCVYDGMCARFRELGVSPSRGSYAAAREMDATVRAARAALMRLFNAPAPEAAVLTPSATFSLNQILLGLPPERTRRIYVSPFEHNSVLRPLHRLTKTRGTEMLILPFNGFGWDEAETRRRFGQAPPDAVAACHASNVFGNVLPVREIFALAHGYGAITVMDCAQSAGTLDVDVQTLGADFTAFPGHKGLCGPSGIGGIIVNCAERLEPLITGGTGVRSEDAEPPEELPDRFESGSLNTLGVIGLGLALQWLEETSLAAVRARKHAMTRMLAETLARYPGKVAVHSDPGRENVGVISCTFASRTPAEAAAILDNAGIAARAGLHCAPLAHRHLGTAPLGTVRLSPGYFTTDADIAALDTLLRGL